MQNIKNFYKQICALSLIGALLFWELILYPVSVAEDFSFIRTRGEQYENGTVANITEESVIVQEASLPEIVNSYSPFISVSHISYGRSLRTGTSFGRFFLGGILTCLLGGGCTTLYQYEFFRSFTDQNLDLLLSFIHDQDGKKKSTDIVWNIA